LNGMFYHVFRGKQYLTLWFRGHESRLDTDEIIAGSHHGPGLVYIAENPPKNENAWVKLWEKGEYEKNKWFVTTELVENRGAHSIQIPDGLKPGK
jgi:lytic cellulose monooxygenase (C1-hydroxylating)